MKKIHQGRKKKVMWYATCTECASEFEEVVSKLFVDSDREGDFAKGTCPDCKIDMFFYPPA